MEERYAKLGGAVYNICVFFALGQGLVSAFGYEVLPVNLGLDTLVGVWVARVILAAGIVMTFWPVVQRRPGWTYALKMPDPSQGHFLCTTGPHAVVRHPNYLGLFMVVIAIEMFVSSNLMFIVTPLMFGGIVLMARKEEMDMATVYGDEYRTYARRTARLIPFIY